LSSPDRADAVIGAAVQALPGFGSGAITLADLEGIKFGGTRQLFDPEPVLFVSVVETCRRLKIPICDCLCPIPPAWQTSRSITELTPAAWLA
jgi:hypothetical protein